VLSRRALPDFDRSEYGADKARALAEADEKTEGWRKGPNADGPAGLVLHSK
jgi:hypothetical protein